MSRGVALEACEARVPRPAMKCPKGPPFEEPLCGLCGSCDGTWRMAGDGVSWVMADSGMTRMVLKDVEVIPLSGAAGCEP